MNDPKTLAEARKKIYDHGSAIGRNIPYKEGRCAYEVWEGWHQHQCTRPNGKGVNNLYCSQHAKQVKP